VNGIEKDLLLVLENLLSNAQKYTPKGGDIKISLDKKINNMGMINGYDTSKTN